MKLGQKVRVYRNLTHKCYSVVDHKTGLVIAHVDKIFLEDVTFTIREGGRRLVQRTGHKNVHAYIVGYITNDRRLQNKRRINYSPKERTKYGYFRYSDDRKIVTETPVVEIGPKGCFTG